MSGAVCPACGVAVVPGYVRCPKCRKRLPQRPAAVEGGTAIEAPARSGGAIVALAAAVLVTGGIIAFFALKKDDTPTVAAPSPAEQPVGATSNETDTTTAPEPAQVAPTAPTAPDPSAIAATLERALKRQRLWARVSVIGGRAEVRSNSCSDAAITPYLDEVAPAFKAAGLTKLRCVEDSGRVVSDRDL